MTRGHVYVICVRSTESFTDRLFQGVSLAEASGGRTSLVRKSLIPISPRSPRCPRSALMCTPCTHKPRRVTA